MMNETESRYCDEAYELAIEKIESMYADTTVEILKNSSFDHLPRDIIVQLDIAQAKIDNRGKPKTIPLGKFTMSDDGKTCNECSSDLVVKNSTVSDSAGVRTIQKLNCPKGCNKLTKSMNKAISDLDSIVKDSQSLTKGCDDLYTIKTRDMPIKRASLILKTNMEHKHLVSAHNTQFTEINFAPVSIYETKEKITKKTGKIINYTICDHNIDDHLNTLHESKIYNVLSVKRIGNLPVIGSDDTWMGKCWDCQLISNKINRKLTHEWNDDNLVGAFDMKSQKVFELVNEKSSEVVYYQITIQRVDAELPKIILEILKEKRFNKKLTDYYLSEEITNFVISKLNYLQVPDTLKSKITSQLKSMYNKNLIEMQVNKHEFASSRQNKSYKQEADKYNLNETWVKNRTYAGGATKINSFRANDNNAVYMTKPVRQQLVDLIQLRKDSKYYSNIEYGFDEQFCYDELWKVIYKNLGLTKENEKDFDIVWNKRTGQIWIASLSGIKRKRK